MAQNTEENAKPATQQEETSESTINSAPEPGEQATTPGALAFIDPVTGELVTPTPERLLELERLRQTDPNLVLPEPDAAVPAPGLGSGMMVPVPAELHPTGHATVGPDGKAIVQPAIAPGGPVIYDGAEHLGPSGAAVADTPSPTTEPIEQGDSAKPDEPAQDHRDPNEDEDDGGGL